MYCDIWKVGLELGKTRLCLALPTFPPATVKHLFSVVWGTCPVQERFTGIERGIEEESGDRVGRSESRTHLCCLIWVITCFLQTKHNLCLPQAPSSDWWQAAGYLYGLLWSVKQRDWHKPFPFCQLIHPLPSLLHAPCSKDTLLLHRDKIH